MSPGRSPELEFALSHARLLALLRYDPDTGEFTWLQSSSNRKPVGSKAGCYKETSVARYVMLGIDGRLFHAHRVAWFYMTGAWPKVVDHRDGDGWNNRWENLREADHRKNAQNTKLYASNRTGAKGVVFYAGRGKPYRVWLDHKYIGCYATLEQAEAARDLAARNAHGEFYRKE